MSNTYSRIYIQSVFAVKFREAIIAPSWEDELQKYITGIVQNQGQKMLAINGTSDHIHLLIGMKPTCNLSDLMRDVKRSSTQFVQEKKFTRYKFQWQERFGAFSYEEESLDRVINYIKNQKEHHKKMTFKEEYCALLQKFKIEYEEEYLFD
jgi:putative transposase